MLLHPSSIVQLDYTKDALVVIGLSSALIWLSLFEGYLADVKLSHFNTLLYSTYIMTVSVSVILLPFILFISTIHSTGLYFRLLLAMVGIALQYCCGKVFFQVNILLFGTDQLRDAPTQYSVLFLYAYLWCDKFSSILILSINTPGHEIIVNKATSEISIDKVKSLCIGIILSLSILFCLFILILVNKKKNWFFTENIRENPSKIVTNVIVFAVRHSPIFALVSMPVYLFLLKPFLSRYVPNMFKRIGSSYTDSLNFTLFSL